MKKTLLFAAVIIMAFGASAQTVIFHESFDKLTDSITGNALLSELVDEPGYPAANISSGSAMKGVAGGIFQMTGGRFRTRNMDLSGKNMLTITFRYAGVAGTEVNKRFQIDMDKIGTNGMGTTFNRYFNAAENQVDGANNTGWQTMEFELLGTDTSYVHFRAESELIIEIDDIKVTKTPSAVSAVGADKPVASVRYFNILGKEVSATTTGLIIVKTLYADGTVKAEKQFRK